MRLSQLLISAILLMPCNQQIFCMEKSDQEKVNLLAQEVEQRLQDRATDCTALGLESNAHITDIRKTFKKLAITKHPDKHGNDPQISEQFVTLKNAFERREAEEEADSTAVNTLNQLKRSLEYSQEKEAKKARIEPPLEKANLTPIIPRCCRKINAEPASFRRLYKTVYNACQHGYIQIVENAINQGIEINNLNDYGNSLLHVAVASGKKAIVETLLKAKAAINICDKYGATPLHEACKHGDLALVKLLVSYKASVDHRDNSGSTPLMNGCFWDKKNVVQYLLEQGADRTIKDYRGKTVSDYVRPTSIGKEIDKLLITIFPPVSNNSQEDFEKAFASFTSDDVENLFNQTDFDEFSKNFLEESVSF